MSGGEVGAHRIAAPTRNGVPFWAGNGKRGRAIANVRPSVARHEVPNWKKRGPTQASQACIARWVNLHTHEYLSRLTDFKIDDAIVENITLVLNKELESRHNPKEINKLNQVQFASIL